MSDLYIMPKDGSEFCLTDKYPNIDLLEMNVGAPQITPAYNSIQGSDGQLLQTVAFNSSTATVSMLIKANTRQEFNLAKSALQGELYSRKTMRIRSSDDPGKAVWVLANPTDINPLDRADDAVVNFTFTVISGTKVTPFNSDELADNLDKLSFGMNLDLDNLPSYHFTSNSFVVNNPSDLAIDPYRQHHDMIIRIKGVGSSVTV
ncbi:phage tail family protein, partial [Fructobacillus sp. CRL 2054]|uniref:phage tail domain-containing protein n=1 Tax=Fructobacillus sp. CRL 2054 TaxID=2763007 RepID=UPI0023799ED7